MAHVKDRTQLKVELDRLYDSFNYENSATDPIQIVRRYTRPDDYFGLNVAGVSEHFFGTKLYANVVMLGIASLTTVTRG